MNNIADANATEMRGWVMLMLQRAAENVNPSECNDPAVLLACSLGSDSCPAACVKDTEKASEEDTAQGSTIDGMAIAGDLTLAVADYSSEIKAAPKAGTVVFNAVDFKSSEKVTIESVKLERTGLSSRTDVAGVWFEKNGVAVSAKATVWTDWTATTRFYNGYSVNGSDTLDLVVELKAEEAGAEVAFNFVGVTSTAKNVSFNTQSSKYRTSTYTVSSVTFEVNGSNGDADKLTYKLGERTEFEIGKFQITNNSTSSEDKDIVVKSLKLKNSKDLDLASTFKNVKVYRDSKVVSQSVELSNKDMTITFDSEQIDSGKKAIYTIMAEVAQLEETGKSVKLKLNKDTELVANEISSNFRVSHKASTKANGSELREYVFNGGKITLTNDSSFRKTVEAAPTSSDVVIAKGSITLAEPIKLNGSKTSPALKVVVNDASKTDAKTWIKNLKVEIWGSTYTTNPVYADEGKTQISYFAVEEDVYISRSSDIRVLVSLNWTPTGVTNTPTIKFSNIGSSVSFTNTSDAWTYENNDQDFNPTKVIAGTIQMSDLIPTPGKFYLTNKATSTQKVVAGNSTDVTLFDGEISSKNWKVSVNKIAVVPTSRKVTADGDQITFTLFINWEASQDAVYNKDVSDAWVEFNNIGEVNTDATMKIKLVAQPSIATADGVNHFLFDVSAQWSDSEGNDVNASAIPTVELDITEGAGVTIANGTATSTVEIASANAELAKFSSTVKNWALSLKGLKVVYDWTINNVVYAEFDGKRVQSSYFVTKACPADTTDKTYTDLSAEKCLETKVADWSTAEVARSNTDASYVIFSNINETLDVWKHEFVLKTNIPDTAVSNITIESITINPGQTSETDTKTLSIAKKFAKAYPVISLVKKDTNEITIKISNPKDSTEDLTVLWIAVSDADKYLADATLNNQSITATAAAEITSSAADTEITSLAAEKQVTLWAWESTELRLNIGNKSADPEGKSIKLTGIKVQPSWSDAYVIWSTYTNVATWADLRISYTK